MLRIGMYIMLLNLIGCGLIKDASVINNWNIKSGISFVNMFTNSRYTFDLKAKAIFDQMGNKVKTNNNLYLTVLTQKKIDKAVNLLNMAEVKIISTNSKSKTIVVEGITL